MMVSTFEHPSYKQVIATNMRNGNAREKLWESLQVILLTFFSDYLCCSVQKEMISLKKAYFYQTCNISTKQIPPSTNLLFKLGFQSTSDLIRYSTFYITQTFDRVLGLYQKDNQQGAINY